MKVIDARSGREVKIGDTIDWGDGEKITLLDVYPGLFSASALVRITYRDDSKAELAPIGRDGEGFRRVRVVKPGPLVTSTREEPLTVKWLHPNYMFQHVAFINS